MAKQLIDHPPYEASYRYEVFPGPKVLVNKPSMWNV